MRTVFLACLLAVSFLSPRDGPSPQECPPYGVVGHEIVDVALQHDMAHFDDVALPGNCQHETRVLLHQEHRDAAFIDVGNGLGDGIDDYGSKAEGRLVHHEELRLGHEGAGDREHLLFAAAQASRPLGSPLLQPGK